MARHVFQYERISPPLGLFLGDPSALPPLGDAPGQVASISSAGGERPLRADTAGLIWTVDGRHPEAKDNTFPIGKKNYEDGKSSRSYKRMLYQHLLPPNKPVLYIMSMDLPSKT
eukprot:gene29887-33724_t